ncbi:hypothetical protein BC826DRAFT_40817 [Russula brevipes]|nr:hypothetical protein BC826DRAFT_40817 [Russula brevipes]
MGGVGDDETDKVERLVKMPLPSPRHQRARWSVAACQSVAWTARAVMGRGPARERETGARQLDILSQGRASSSLLLSTHARSISIKDIVKTTVTASSRFISNNCTSNLALVLVLLLVAPNRTAWPRVPCQCADIALPEFSILPTSQSAPLPRRHVLLLQAVPYSRHGVSTSLFLYIYRHMVPPSPWNSSSH